SGWHPGHPKAPSGRRRPGFVARENGPRVAVASYLLLRTSSGGSFFLPRNYLSVGVSQPIQNLQLLPGGTPASTLPLSGQARRSRPRRTGRHERPKRLLFRFLQLLFTPRARLARPLRANRPVRFIVPLFITMRFAHRPGRARVRPGSCRLLGRTMYETDIPWWDAEAGKETSG